MGDKTNPAPQPKPTGPDTPANAEQPAPGDEARRAAAGTESLIQLGQVTVPAAESNVFCLTIIGQIEGHLMLPPQNKTTKYEHVIPQLVAAEQNPKVEGLLVVLNTVGGDVEAGLAIAEMISSLSKPTVAVVLGGGHSIGVPIAVSADYTFIAETATMTIHPIRLNGLIIGVPQTFEYLDKMQERVVRFVRSHSRVTEEKFKELMFKTGELTRDIGTTVIGPEAVAHGLIDEIGGIGEALRELNRRIAERKQGAGSASGSAAISSANAAPGSAATSSANAAPAPSAGAAPASAPPAAPPLAPDSEADSGGDSAEGGDKG